MGALSTFAVNGLHDLTLRGDSFASPSTVYLTWFTTPPGPSGGVEVSGGGFAREAVVFSPAALGNIEQSGTVTWSTFHAGADQMVSGWGIYDDATAGNLLAYGRTPSHVVRMGAAFSASGITISSNDAHMSDALANGWLDHLFTGTAYTAPIYVAVGLFTTTPTAATAGTQVGTSETVTFYAAAERSSVLQLGAGWFPLDLSDPHELTGWAVLDDGDNPLWFADWPTPISVPANNTFTVPDGSLTLRAN